MAAPPSKLLAKIAEDGVLLEVGRKAIEDALVEFRDSRVAVLRNNGLVIKERDGRDSSTIRLGPEDALRIGLRAIAEYVEAATKIGVRP